jgi:hypothetical protein
VVTLGRLSRKLCKVRKEQSMQLSTVLHDDCVLVIAMKPGHVSCTVCGVSLHSLDRTLIGTYLVIERLY